MKKSARILAAVASGADTSREIACLISLHRAAVSVALCRLADIGRVERAGVANEGRLGRPCVRWRLRRGSRG